MRHRSLLGPQNSLPMISWYHRIPLITQRSTFNAVIWLCMYTVGKESGKVGANGSNEHFVVGSPEVASAGSAAAAVALAACY